MLFQKRNSQQELASPGVYVVSLDSVKYSLIENKDGGITSGTDVIKISMTVKEPKDFSGFVYVHTLRFPNGKSHEWALNVLYDLFSKFVDCKEIYESKYDSTIKVDAVVREIELSENPEQLASRFEKLLESYKDKNLLKIKIVVNEFNGKRTLRLPLRNFCSKVEENFLKYNPDLDDEISKPLSGSTMLEV